MELLLVSLPASIALTFKVILLLYARRSPVHNRQTRIFLFLLFALALQNIAEISSYFVSHGGRVPLMEGYLYFAASILILLFLLHLALSLTLETLAAGARTKILGVAYVYAASLMVLLLFTPWLVSGFSPLGVSYYRIPGRLYPLFEIFAVACLAASLGLFAYGSLREPGRSKRTKLQFMLIGMLPMSILVEVNIILMHFGINWINTPMTFPAAVTFFLAVTTYAIHQYRLFDIQFYLPWSKVRKHKTVFYERIRSLVAEIADLASPGEVIDRLADTLGCPVALIGADQPALAMAGGSRFMAQIPQDTLRHFDHIVVANEIADSSPDYRAVLQRHGVAAVVPFHPHSQHAAGWLLLGESFSEHVYTKLDFQVVEQLFDKMADLFLDKLLVMRTQLADASRSIRDLQNQRQELTASIMELRKQSDLLQKQNELLRRERPVDSLTSLTGAGTELLSPNERFAANITLLGRDKSMVKRLRLSFSQVQSYVSIDSAGFRNQALPDVLIAFIDAGDLKARTRLCEFLSAHREKTAALLYGPAAADFAASNRSALVGGIFDVLPGHHTDELLVRRIRALGALRQAVCSLADSERPLIGQSQEFIEQIAATQRLAGFKEPVLLKAHDSLEAAATAAFMHSLSGRKGALRIWQPRSIAENDSTAHGLSPDALTDLATAAGEARDGSLVIRSMGEFSAKARAALMDTVASAGNARLIAICDAATKETEESIEEGFGPFVIDLPDLRQRKSDVALLIHYFTLQFNLQGGTHFYLTQSQIDDLLASEYPDDIAELKRSVFARLSARFSGQPESPSEQIPADAEAADRTLDDCVAELEARIITQTLERCGGNKSKAARLLGLRPNTLHYKLGRYGIAVGKNG